MGVVFTILLTPGRAAFMLMIVTSVGILALRTLQGGSPLYDPFEPYASILPGNPREAVVEAGFTCRASVAPSYGEICSLIPDDGIFSRIDTIIADGTGRIRTLRFMPRKDTLFFGQLFLLWDKPEITSFGEWVNLRWQDFHVAVSPQTHWGRFSYQIPLTYVAFEYPG